jgi:hypothetical protein
MTGETYLVAFGMRKARADDLLERSPRHLPNATLYEVSEGIAWAAHSDFKGKRKVGLPIYPSTLNKEIEDWKPALREWADKYNIAHDLILFLRGVTGYLTALLPVVRQYRMRSKDWDLFREPLRNGGFKKA